MDDLDRLSDWMAPLLSRLQPREQRQLAREIARDLRQDNTQRMRAQAGPDGQQWEPRKATTRSARGQLRSGPLFTRLGRAKHFKASGSPQEAVVQFVGRAERIARVHHFGLRDRVKPGGPEYDYPARPLLGITQEFEEKLRDRIINHLART